MSIDDMLRRAATEVRQVTGSALPPRVELPRRRPRLIVLGVGVATAIVAALVAVASFHNGKTVVSVGPPSSVANPLADPVSRNLITTRLTDYIRAVDVGDMTGAIQAGHPSWWQGSMNTGPVLDDGQVIAVAAFSWDPRGPVLVLSYYGGRWNPTAYLPDPWCPCQGFAPEPSTIDLRTPIQVGDVTGDGRPDFLISMTAAGTTRGAVLTQDGANPGKWRYAPFSGPFATDTKVGGDPRIQGSHIVITYNNCEPNCAQGQQWPIIWTYERATGEFSALTSAATPPTTVSAGSPRIAVTKCPTTYGAGTPPAAPDYPAIPVDLPESTASQLGFYTTDTNGVPPVLGPAGWACTALVGADGGTNVTIYPPRSTAPRAGTLGQASVIARSDSACQSCVYGTVCRFVPDAARQLGYSGSGLTCAPPPRGESTYWIKGSANAAYPISDVIGFNDPGKPDPTDGVILYDKAGPGNGSASEQDCTLPAGQHSLCTAILNNFSAQAWLMS